jgi:hypothetical protein
MVSSLSANFLSSVSISVKLTDKFTLLEEPSDDSAVVSVLNLLADGPNGTVMMMPENLIVCSK